VDNAGRDPAGFAPYADAERIAHLGDEQLVVASFHPSDRTELIAQYQDLRGVDGAWFCHLFNQVAHGIRLIGQPKFYMLHISGNPGIDTLVCADRASQGNYLREASRHCAGREPRLYGSVQGGQLFF